MLIRDKRERMTLSVLMFTGVLLLSSCAGMRERQSIREGLLTLELSQPAFVSVWGKPTRTLAMTGDQIIKAGISGWGGFYFKGGEMYEMWQYDSNQTNLIFHGRKLVAWQTPKTTQELTTPSWFSFGQSSSEQ